MSRRLSEILIGLIVAVSMCLPVAIVMIARFQDNWEKRFAS